MRFIVTADWHCRQEVPRCREDSDWLDTQRQGIRKVKALATKHKVPVIHTGDIFHHPRVATEVVNMVMEGVKGFEYGFYLMAGNHDLPFHSVDNLHQSSIGTLLHLVPTPDAYGDEIGRHDYDWAHFGTDTPGTGEIRLIHRLIWPDAKTRPTVIEDVGQTAEELLAEFPENKWICCGDYHHRFHFEKDGRHVVNPGCLNIQAADMIGYTPGVYLVDTLANTAEFLAIPDNGNLMTDSYLREAEEKDRIREERMDAMIAKIQSTGGISLDFDANVDIHVSKASPLAITALCKIRERALVS